MDPDNEEKSIDKDRGFIKEIFADAFDLKFGLAQTAWMLIKNPKKVVNSYINKEKSHYFAPYKFLMIFVALSAFVFFLAVDYETLRHDTMQRSLDQFAIEDEEARERADKIAQKQTYLSEKCQNDYGAVVTLLIWLPIYSLFSFLFFKKQIGRFANHFAMNAYLIGQVSFIQFIIALPLFFLVLESSQLSNYMNAFFLALMIYYIYAYLRIFSDKKPGTIIKSIFSPIISQLLVLIIVEVGTAIAAVIIVKQQLN